MENRQFLGNTELLEEVDFRHFFLLIRRNLGWLLGVLILSGAGAFLISLYQTPIYAASTQVMVTRMTSSASVADVTQTLNTQQLTQTYVELLTQPWMLDEVSARVGSAVEEGQIEASAATNTMIINLTVEDPEPARARLIADTLVQVLISQNEKIQSGRYTEAQAGLETQIQQIQAQITETQSKLDVVKTVAVDDKLAKLQERINTAKSNIESLNAEMELINSVDLENRDSLIIARQQALEQSRLSLETQLAEYQALKDRLETDPQLAQDANARAEVQARMAEVGAAINPVRETNARLEAEMSLLMSVDSESTKSSALEERRSAIALQQTLLDSYQTTYTNTLASDQVQVNSDEVSNLENDLKLYQQIYLNLLNNRENIRLQKMQNVPNVIQVNPAMAGELPVRPRTLLNTVLGGVAGLVLAVSAVLLTDFLDTTIKSKEDVDRVLNLPVIGYIPQLDKQENAKAGPFVMNNQRAPAAEAFRSLRTNLEFISVDHPLKSILVTSTGASEGKTTVAANLGTMVVQSGKRVVIVDADLRRPRLHKEMNMPNRLGLSDVFRDRVNLDSVIQPVQDTGLFVITSGGIPPNPAELLASEKMRQILEQLESQFDFVIVDSTPTLVTDSQLIGARTDGVLMVLWPGRTHADAARTTAEQYRRAGANLLGVVLNNIQPERSYGGYGGYYYQNHYYDQPDLKKKGVFHWLKFARKKQAK